MYEHCIIFYTLPDTRVDASKVVSWTGTDEGFIRNKIGFTERPFLSVSEAPSSLAATAVDGFFGAGDARKKPTPSGATRVDGREILAPELLMSYRANCHICADATSSRAKAAAYVS